jgi:hypothetical protein
MNSPAMWLPILEGNKAEFLKYCRTVLFSKAVSAFE